MTRKKFVDALLKAIMLFTDTGIKESKKFKGSKVGMFYGIDENGKGETDHYILIELADGTCWRLVPQRALELQDYEREMWDRYKQAEESGELDDIGDGEMVDFFPEE